MTSPQSYQPGWYADPGGRYDFRYHNGTNWTNDVSRDGRRLIDGVDGGADNGDGGHRDRRATTALVLAIIGLCLSWMPLFFIGGAICAVVGIVLGVGARRRTPRDSRGFAGLSIVIGGIALAVCAVGIWMTTWIYGLVDDYENPPASEVTALRCFADDETVVLTGVLANVGDERSAFRVIIELEPADTGLRRHQVTIPVPALAPGETAPLDTTRRIVTGADGDVQCSVSAVTGPLPLGIRI